MFLFLKKKKCGTRNICTCILTIFLCILFYLLGRFLYDLHHMTRCISRSPLLSLVTAGYHQTQTQIISSSEFSTGKVVARIPITGLGDYSMGIFVYHQREVDATIDSQISLYLEDVYITTLVQCQDLPAPDPLLLPFFTMPSAYKPVKFTLQRPSVFYITTSRELPPDVTVNLTYIITDSPR